MTKECVTNRVKVFISSMCDRKGELKYGVMRKALAFLLEETNMCEIFVFEEGGATSYNVVNSYMDPLADSDLVIVIADNKDGITLATMNEINRARALKKKCIYIFCDQREKNITELQAQLQSDTSNPRFCVVHEFSDIPKRAYEAVINDVLSLYISYCKGRVDYNTLISTEVISEDKRFSISSAVDSDISRDFFKDFSYTKYIVQKEAGVAWGDVSAEAGVDYNCACLIGQVIGSSLTELPDFEKIKADIKAMHENEIQKLVMMRYEAVENYFHGNINSCIDKLNNCIDFCNGSINIPKWMSKDVALDLRNIQAEADREKDIINLKSRGQNILDEDEEPLYYPVIDRITADYNESIVKHWFNTLTQSPFAVNLGGVNYEIEEVCNAFLVAYCYGSITHMIILRKRLYQYLTGVSLEIRWHKMFMFTIKLLFMANDEKILKQFLSAYGENTNNINDQDIMYFFNGIEKQPVNTRNILARLYLMKYFGYYYSDEQFERETEFLVKEIKDCIENKYATNIMVKPMLEAMVETSHRFKEKLILEFVYFIFKHGNKRYYDDAFNAICHFKYKNLNEDEQLGLQRFIMESISDKDIRSNCHHVFPAAQAVRQMETISHDDLDQAVQKYDQKFYEETYLLNVNNHDKEESWKYTKNYIDRIISDNETQGKNGAYSDNVINFYQTIANIMIIEHIKYNSQQMRKLINCIQGTLFAETQTMDAKVDAIELLCILQLEHPNNRQIRKLANRMTVQWSQIVNAQNPFFKRGYSRENLELNFNILRLILKIGNESEFIRSIVQIQSSEIASQITSLSMLERLFRENVFSLWNTSEMGSLFQYVMNSSYSDNYDVRFCAMSVLIKFLVSSYRQLCLERLVEMIDNEPYKNKVGMLYRLRYDNLDDPKVKYIFDKGKSDSHYWVRVAANSIFETKE